MNQFDASWLALTAPLNVVAVGGLLLLLLESFAGERPKTLAADGSPAVQPRAFLTTVTLMVLAVAALLERLGFAFLHPLQPISPPALAARGLTIAGVVRDPGCRPMRDAVIEVWQANAHGDYDLVSLGADGQPGGEGEATDVTSW